MNTDAKLYYAVLGVDPAASDAAIRLAFRRRAKELHPDSVSGSANAFIRLKRAYDTLSDPVRRAEYDRDCRDVAPPPPPPQATPHAPPLAAAPTPSRRRPPPPRPRPQPRTGGIGFVRYAIAFLIMGGISFGAIEAMISFTEAPPAVPVRMSVPRSASSRTDAEPTAGPAAESGSAAPAPGSSRSGFWDAGPTPAPAAPTRRAAPAAKQW